MKGSTPTKAERELHDKLREHGCAVSKYIFGHDDTPAEIHHIVEGGKRLGHSHVIPLAPIFHRQGTAEYPSIHSVNGAHGSKAAFKNMYGVDEWDLLEKCQEWLGWRYSEAE